MYTTQNNHTFMCAHTYILNNIQFLLHNNYDTWISYLFLISYFCAISTKVPERHKLKEDLFCIQIWRGYILKRVKCKRVLYIGKDIAVQSSSHHDKRGSKDKGILLLY